MDTGKTYQTKLTNQHQKEEDDTKDEPVDGKTQSISEETDPGSETEAKVLKLDESK